MQVLQGRVCIIGSFSLVVAHMTFLDSRVTLILGFLIVAVDALAQEQAFDTIRIFERREKVGGCW